MSRELIVIYTYALKETCIKLNASFFRDYSFCMTRAVSEKLKGEKRAARGFEMLEETE